MQAKHKKWIPAELNYEVHSTSEIKVVIKLPARMQLATTRLRAHELIMAFKQHYRNELRVHKNKKNRDVSEQDKAMDFFSELHNVRNIEYKTTFPKNLQLKACNPPGNLI
jgi:hypothetical protein